MTRKCWNCGEPTDDDDLRVCNDPICGAAAIKLRTRVKDMVPDDYYWRNREKILLQRKEYRQRPEVKKRLNEYEREYVRRPENKERRNKQARERYKRRKQEG